MGESLRSPVPIDSMIACFSLNVRKLKQMTSAIPIGLYIVKV